MCGIVENRVLEWKATVAVCQNSGKKWVLGVCVQLFAVLFVTTSWTFMNENSYA